MKFRHEVSVGSSWSRSLEFDYHTLIALAIFLLNAVIFVAFFDAAYDPDSVRGWRQFNSLLPAHSVFFWGTHNQIELRIYMLIATLGAIFILYVTGFIERAVLVTYLALPAAAYLATKVRVEFIFFPFAIISTRLGWQREALVVASLLALSVMLGEKNGYVILFYRVSLMAFRLFRPRGWIIVLAAVSVLLLDQNIDALKPFVPNLAAYDWTRNIVNPEYSVAETIGVMLTSMILSINPPVDFMIGLPATIVVFAMIFGRKILSRSAWGGWLRSPELRSGFLTILTFTSITHAFQNARYYFFYLPVFTGIGGERANTILLIVSVPITCIMTVFYKLILGM